MKRLILAPLVALVGCGTGAFDPGAQRTTAAEARATWKMLFESAFNETGLDADPTLVDQATELIVDSQFQEIRAIHDAGISELNALLASRDNCLTSTEPGLCNLCWTAIIAAVYDE